MTNDQRTITIPIPTVAPFGIEIDGVEAVQEVWDVFVAPSQSYDAPPQSIEMRVLMAILRSVAVGLEQEANR